MNAINEPKYGSRYLDSDRLQQEIDLHKREFTPNPAFEGAVGVTMFDVSDSKDNLITVLVKQENLKDLPSQALVEIRPGHAEDGRTYHGIVVEGPFYQPDGLRPDAPIIVTTAVNGMTFVPNYHGRVQVELISQVEGGTPMPPRYRPLPNSPVFVLSQEETEKALNLEGDIVLGLALGHEHVEVKLPSVAKSVLPRHLGILGTAGGGKSTTVCSLIAQFQQTGIASVLIDTEGEYTRIDEPTQQAKMAQLLRQRGLQPTGVHNIRILHPVGRETTNPNHTNRQEFSLCFSEISPYTIMEILMLTKEQSQRYLKAYDLGRALLRALKIFPKSPADHQMLGRMDDTERGYPGLDLEMMYDIIQACSEHIVGERSQEQRASFQFQSATFQACSQVFWEHLKSGPELPGNMPIWRSLQGKIGRLLHLNIFDAATASPLDYTGLTVPGTVTIVDLGDTDSPQINSLVIAELLRGLLQAQNLNYQRFQQGQEFAQRRVMLLIEEAHEFLHRQRIANMPVLFSQVTRTARRGRKRWLGLGFISQLPQHLPDELLTLINAYILHKIGDPNIIHSLRRSIGGVDDALWRKLTHLSPGQAVVSNPQLTRALLVAIDPAPCRLLMQE